MGNFEFPHIFNKGTKALAGVQEKIFCAFVCAFVLLFFCFLFFEHEHKGTND